MSANGAKNDENRMFFFILFFNFGAKLLLFFELTKFFGKYRGRFFDSAYHLSCPYDSMPISHCVVVVDNLVATSSPIVPLHSIPCG